MSDIKEHKQLEGIRICATTFYVVPFIFPTGGGRSDGPFYSRESNRLEREIKRGNNESKARNFLIFMLKYVSLKYIRSDLRTEAESYSSHRENWTSSG